MQVLHRNAASVFKMHYIIFFKNDLIIKLLRLDLTCYCKAHGCIVGIYYERLIKVFAAIVQQRVLTDIAGNFWAILNCQTFVNVHHKRSNIIHDLNHYCKIVCYNEWSSVGATVRRHHTKD